MSVWQELFIILGGNIVLLGMVGWLIRAILTHQLTKDLKKFEAELKANVDASTEQLKISLHLTATEHQVRFSNLHAKRAEVIAELYRQIVECLQASENLALEFKRIEASQKDENLKKQDMNHVFYKVIEKFLKFSEFFKMHRVYLPDSTCKMLDSFLESLGPPIFDFSAYFHIEAGSSNSPEQAQLNRWREASEHFQKSAPLIRQSLETEFRQILGAA